MLCGGFHSHGGSPSHHPFLDWIFPNKNPSSYWGYPHDELETPTGGLKFSATNSLDHPAWRILGSFSTGMPDIGRSLFMGWEYHPVIHQERPTDCGQQLCDSRGLFDDNGLKLFLALNLSGKPLRRMIYLHFDGGYS